MKIFLLLTFTLASLIITSCSKDDCLHIGEVTLTFERMPSPNPTLTMVFYTIDGVKTEILRDNLESLSYTTTLNIGNYSVCIYSPDNIIRKEIGFQIKPDTDVKIVFDQNFNPSRIYD